MTALHRLPAAAAAYGAVALGSTIGGCARALVSIALAQPPGAGFPWATLVVNVTGSFVIGFYATLTEPGGRRFAGAAERRLVMTGICGGYTTFSLFSLETLQLLQAGRFAAAGLNLGVSLIAWLGAVWLGHALALRLNRLR